MKFSGTLVNGLPLKEYSDAQIKEEPMLHKASYNFALEQGGIITHDFLSSLKGDANKDFGPREELTNIVIDSRVHMLMKGWYPCIPGWHHDDVARTRDDGQPNYKKMPYESKHAMAIVGDVAPTEFLIGTIGLTIPRFGVKIYERWDNVINYKLKQSKYDLSTIKIRPSRVLYFDWAAFHRGMPADYNGWRFFIRATWNTNRKPLNEIRRQSNVYMSAINAGW